MTQRHLNGIRSYRLRQDPALGQQELAERIGSCQADISAYELGKTLPTLPRAFEIAAALDVPIEELFFQAAEVARNRVLSRFRDHSH